MKEKPVELFLSQTNGNISSFLMPLIHHVLDFKCNILFKIILLYFISLPFNNILIGPLFPTSSSASILVTDLSL